MIRGVASGREVRTAFLRSLDLREFDPLDMAATERLGVKLEALVKRNRNISTEFATGELRGFRLSSIPGPTGLNHVLDIVEKKKS